jgi:hypothetical protein
VRRLASGGGQRRRQPCAITLAPENFFSWNTERKGERVVGGRPHTHDAHLQMTENPVIATGIFIVLPLSINRRLRFI